MIYRSESEAVRRVFWLARELGVWPGYKHTERGWVLTYDPQQNQGRGDYEGQVLI